MMLVVKALCCLRMSFMWRISRHKESVKVYTDDKETMARKARTEQRKECVLDYFEKYMVSEDVIPY